MKLRIRWNQSLGFWELGYWYLSDLSGRPLWKHMQVASAWTSEERVLSDGIRRD